MKEEFLDELCLQIKKYVYQAKSVLNYFQQEIGTQYIYFFHVCDVITQIFIDSKL